MSSIDPGSASDTVAHVIQVALTPIFLLTGCATLLNVLSTKHSTVATRVDTLVRDFTAGNSGDSDGWGARVRDLRRRSALLEAAIFLAILAAISTCLAAMLLFLGEIDVPETGSLLFGTFGAALTFVIAALVPFAGEIMLEGQTLRSALRSSERNPVPHPRGHARKVDARATRTG